MVLDEEPLSDPLVDDNKSHLWNHLSLVVDLSEDVLELGDLNTDDLVPHGVSHTISVDDVVGWQIALVVGGEGVDSFLEGLLHLALDNLLALLLDEELRVVLAHLFVDGAGEAHDGVGSRVTDIDSNEHGPHLLHGLWEFQVEEVTSNLAVDLSEDVGGFGGVEAVGISDGDHLRWDLVLLEEFLVHLVLIFLAKHNDDHLGVSEHTTFAWHHVVEELLFDLESVSLIFSLDKGWLFNLDLELSTSLDEGIVDLVRCIVEAPLA